MDVDELEIIALDELEEDEVIVAEVIAAEEDASEELDDEAPDIVVVGVDVAIGAELEDDAVEATGADDVVITLDADDGLLLERATYAPAPATTIITTKITAIAAAAIPLTSFTFNFRVSRSGAFFRRYLSIANSLLSFHGIIVGLF